jgi:hypothetical protein
MLTHEALERLVAVVCVRVFARRSLSPPTIRYRLPSEDGAERIERVGSSMLMYMPVGAPDVTRPATAWDFWGCALAKKSPRSRNGSWVARTTCFART